MFLIIFAMMILSSCSENKIKCIIKGKVIDRDSDTLILNKSTEDTRIAENIYIPIINKHFEYQLTLSSIQAYELIFKDELEQGVWRPIIIFPENGTIELTLNSMEKFDQNIVNGGELQKQYNDYQKLIKSTFINLYKPLGEESDKLYNSGEYYSDEMKIIQEKIRKTNSRDSLLIIFKERDKLINDGKDKTPEAQTVYDKILKLNDKAIKWRYQYINENPSIATYYLIIDDLFNTSDRDKKEGYIREIFPVFAKEFPSHPYTKLAKDQIEVMNIIKIGGQYIDFSAPDLTGESIQFSQIVQNHDVVLLDLWASWCSPCIAKAKTMIPVYEEYKDKGFTICAVAREKKNTVEMEKAIERNKFPWINLIDLDDENKIWQKYDIPFFVDNTFGAGGALVQPLKHNLK